ncbi:AsmA family protein [Hyphomicrobium sp. CS1GBMeth3]|uniref:AsmA family protein n=1 Tax=Hyphomicrobium sp. CS1GBMeth3 TaxID=1892845 RepID=UPI000931F979|nr:AsmA family protein [Hyphomicrobium sp. CS1GBMeth3]
MATDPGTPAQPPRRRSTAWRTVRLVLIGIAVSLALLIAFPPTGLIKDQLAASIGQSIGRTVAIGGMHIRYWPKLEVAFDAVAVSNPPNLPARDVFRAETVKVQVEPLPLLKGRLRLQALDLIKPTIALEEGADGTKNWVFDTAGAADSGAVPAEFSLPPVSTIADGTLTFQSAVTGASYAASTINSAQTLDLVSGALVAKGNLAAGGEMVTFDATVGDFNAITSGASTTLKATVDARPLRASLDGDALFAAAAEFKGALTASSPSLIQLARWLGSDIAEQGTPLRSSLEGKIVATTRDVTFSETNVQVNTTSGRFDGTLDLGGVRPKLAGEVASEHLDLARIAGAVPRTSFAPTPAPDFDPLVTSGWEQLLGDLTALEKGAQAAPEPAPAAASPSAAPGWSEQPFNLKALQAFDLDLIIQAAAITYGGLDLKQGRVKTAVADGVLDANIEQLAVGAGAAVGTVKVDSRAEPPRAAVNLTLTNVAAEPIVTEFTGRPLLAGTSNVEITATAAGQNQSQLAQTLDGKAHFRMGQGALRGFDVRRMIFEWWKSWKFDLAYKTGFERLEASYDIKKGVLRSQPGLSLGGSEVEIDSQGTVSVPSRQLNQEIRVKAIPPPTALPIPVRISGSWEKPSVGIDWWGLFSAGPSVGGPQALAAAPEPPPANVQAAIRRVLDADLPQSRLTPEARSMLESLLPRETAP